jgi:tetratricopeptide (TPR) repeat protein
VLTSLGVNAYLAKDPAAAREHFERARSLNPKATAASVNLALLNWEKGDVEGTRKELERTLSVDPANPEALVNMGVVEAARGAFEQAAARYNQALEAAPRRATLYNLGTLRLGRAASERSRLQRVPTSTRRTLRRATSAILLLRGRIEEAVATGAARRDAPVARCPPNLALCTSPAVRTAGARQLLARWNRRLHLAHINLGILFESMGRSEGPTGYLRR